MKGNLGKACEEVGGEGTEKGGMGEKRGGSAVASKGKKEGR